MLYSLIPVAQAQAPALATMFPILLLFIIFYFLIFKPQKQKQDDHRKMIAALEKNSEVITIGGIHGTLVHIKDGSVVLRIADNVKIELQKSAIAGLKKNKPEARIEEK